MIFGTAYTDHVSNLLGSRRNNHHGRTSGFSYGALDEGKLPLTVLIIELSSSNTKKISPVLKRRANSLKPVRWSSRASPSWRPSSGDGDTASVGRSCFFSPTSSVVVDSRDDESDSFAMPPHNCASIFEGSPAATGAAGSEPISRVYRRDVSVHPVRLGQTSKLVVYSIENF